MSSLLLLLALAGFRLRQITAYTIGTRWMPISELSPLLTARDREALEQMRRQLHILHPAGARLPGLFAFPVLRWVP